MASPPPLDRWALLGLKKPEGEQKPASDALADQLLFALGQVGSGDPVHAILDSVAEDLSALGEFMNAHGEMGARTVFSLSRRVRVALLLLQQTDRSLEEQARSSETSGAAKPSPEGRARKAGAKDDR